MSESIAKNGCVLYVLPTVEKNTIIERKIATSLRQFAGRFLHTFSILLSISLALSLSFVLSFFREALVRPSSSIPLPLPLVVAYTCIDPTCLTLIENLCLILFQVNEKLTHYTAAYSVIFFRSCFALLSNTNCHLDWMSYTSTKSYSSRNR